MRPAARSRSQAQPNAAMPVHAGRRGNPDSRNLFEAVGFEADYGARRILGAGVVELPVKDAAGTTDIDTKRTCPDGIGRDRIRLC